MSDTDCAHFALYKQVVCTLLINMEWYDRITWIIKWGVVVVVLLGAPLFNLRTIESLKGNCVEIVCVCVQQQVCNNLCTFTDGHARIFIGRWLM